jgi:peptide/nickel transport system permease protein
MGRYILRRLIYAIPVLLISSVLVFLVVHATADPLAAARLNPRVRPQDIERVREALGLDKSGFQQYMTWLGNFLVGNWGTSLASGIAVFPQIKSALWNSFILGATATVVSLAVGVGIGLYSSLKQYSKFDYIATGGAFLGLSMPVFWFALIVQLFFGVYMTRWFHLSEPIFFTAGMTAPGSVGINVLDRVRHLFLPVLVVSVQVIAVYSRYMRASMLEVLQSDFLRTARSKGIRERRVVVRHAMRNALIPITTQVALDVGTIAGGLIITETIFAWPGMGSLFIDAMNSGDYMVILPWLMVTVTFVILFNLVADILYAFLDPRIRYA